jgi:hypothetical protein
LKEPHDLFVAKRARVAFDRFAQHLRLALGPIEVRCVQSLRNLRRSHLLRDASTLVQQLVDLCVDAIDALAKRLNVGGRRCLRQRALGLRRLLLRSGHDYTLRTVNTPSMPRNWSITESGTAPSMSISV